MYARPSGYRYPSQSLRVPDNYSGNTFRENRQDEEPPEVREEETASVPINDDPQNAMSEAAAASKRGFGLRLGSIFGKNGGIGTEELLILALILLLADSDEGFDDLILFLVLLFFIK